MDICGGGRTQIQWAAEEEREQLGLKGQRQKIREVEENVTERLFWEKVPTAGSQWKRNTEKKHIGFMWKERELWRGAEEESCYSVWRSTWTQTMQPETGDTCWDLTNGDWVWEWREPRTAARSQLKEQDGSRLENAEGIKSAEEKERE